MSGANINFSPILIMALIISLIIFREDIPSAGEFTTFIKNEFETNKFFSTAALIGLVTSLLATFRQIPTLIWSRIKRLIEYRVEVNNSDELYSYISEWVMDNKPRLL